MESPRSSSPVATNVRSVSADDSLMNTVSNPMSTPNLVGKLEALTPDTPPLSTATSQRGTPDCLTTESGQSSSAPEGSGESSASSLPEEHAKSSGNVGMRFPDWFARRNITLREESRSSPAMVRVCRAEAHDEIIGSLQSTGHCRPLYKVHENVYGRLRNVASAALLVPGLADDLGDNLHVILKPIRGDSFRFLEGMMLYLAKDLDADLILISTQDIADVAQDALPMVEDNDLRESLLMLPFTAHLDPLVGRRQELSWRNVREKSDLQGLIDSLFCALELKRKAAINDASPAIGAPIPPWPEEGPRKLLIYVSDFYQMESSAVGSTVLQMLQESIRVRRRKGEAVLLAGNDRPKVSDDGRLSRSLPNRNISEFKGVAEHEIAHPLTVALVPVNSRKQYELQSLDKCRWTQNFNIRNIKRAIRAHTANSTNWTNFVALEGVWDLSGLSDLSAELDQEPWPLARIGEIAIEALGRATGQGKLDCHDIAQLVKELHSRDHILSENPSVAQHRLSSRPASGQQAQQAVEDWERKIERIRDEAKEEDDEVILELLKGIVWPEQISVTYDDIRLPADVIDSIKRLVSLTITHPEVSSYGTLQKGKIPGALLYGPPGTGKTLLAKAVARDSHALMLEVSSADILACRVGESEKIIKKLFALVIKLSPCVVFIDEADALLRGRGKGDIYWVRTQINQFLREWDGVTTQKKSAFIMVATNRPGDIDDAVLRRLPRRIEIPLPDVSARKEILDLYLQGETHEISTIRLARETDFYSGSDLRNLCTEAALTAAAELIEDGRTSWTQGEAPPRVLKAKHFEEAKRMIRPSVNHQILNEIEEFKARFGGGTKAKQNFAVDTYRHVSQWVRIRAKRR